ncbi:MAG: ATP synthase F1 subunit delta [Flavobacteriia bacterium]|nr:MAG: ATP synthase F1 subunit delta [Flavobacteriia bacterium]
MSTRAAHRYAKAILDLAVKNKQEDAVYKDMQLIAETFAADSKLEEVLKSPMLKYQDKHQLVNKIFEGKTTTLVTQLFKLLTDNKRLDILNTITSQFTKLYNDQKGIVKAVVTSAVALHDVMTKKVMDKAQSLVGDKKVLLQSQVDESLIGGFILRVGDVQLDTSIAGQLKKLKRELIEQ